MAEEQLEARLAQIDETLERDIKIIDRILCEKTDPEAAMRRFERVVENNPEIDQKKLKNHPGVQQRINAALNEKGRVLFREGMKKALKGAVYAGVGLWGYYFIQDNPNDMYTPIISGFGALNTLAGIFFTCQGIKYFSRAFGNLGKIQSPLNEREQQLSNYIWLHDFKEEGG